MKLSQLKRSPTAWRQTSATVITQRQTRATARIALEDAKEDIGTLVDMLGRIPSREQLQKVYDDLDACQKVIHYAGGFDPAYVTDAQASLKVLEKLLNDDTLWHIDKPSDNHLAQEELNLPTYGD